MTSKVSDHHRYGLEVKGQCQIYLRSMLWLGAQTSLSCPSEGVNSSHFDCLCCVNYMEVSDHQRDLGVKDQSQIYLKSLLPLVTHSVNFYR